MKRHYKKLQSKQLSYFSQYKRLKISHKEMLELGETYIEKQLSYSKKMTETNGVYFKNIPVLKK